MIWLQTFLRPLCPCNPSKIQVNDPWSRWTMAELQLMQARCSANLSLVCLMKCRSANGNLWKGKASVTIAIQTRFENPVTIEIRFGLESSIREKIEHVQFFHFFERNGIAIVTDDSSLIQLESRKKLNIFILYSNAWFELESSRNWYMVLQSISNSNCNRRSSPANVASRAVAWIYVWTVLSCDRCHRRYWYTLTTTKC